MIFPYFTPQSFHGPLLWQVRLDRTLGRSRLTDQRTTTSPVHPSWFWISSLVGNRIRSSAVPLLFPSEYVPSKTGRPVKTIDFRSPKSTLTTIFKFYFLPPQSYSFLVGCPSLDLTYNRFKFLHLVGGPSNGCPSLWKPDSKHPSRGQEPSSRLFSFRPTVGTSPSTWLVKWIHRWVLSSVPASSWHLYGPWWYLTTTFSFTLWWRV